MNFDYYNAMMGIGEQYHRDRQAAQVGHLGPGWANSPWPPQADIADSLTPDQVAALIARKASESARKVREAQIDAAKWAKLAESVL